MYKYWITMLLLLVLALVFYNEWRLDRNLQSLLHERDSASQTPASPPLESTVAGLQSRLESVELDLTSARTQVSNLTAKIARLEETLSHIQKSNLMPTVPERQLFSLTRRSWGSEQAVGPPDTFRAGDLSTAWASLHPDDGPEWLQLNYSNMVDVAQIIIRETYQPGAVTKITSVLPNGQEYTLWEGIESAGAAPFDSVFNIPGSVNANSIKIYLDTSRVRGWNEIDAVELIGRDGSRQWAATASASSSFADLGAITATR